MKPMGFMQAVRTLFHLQTGARCKGASSPESEATAAVFLPLAGLLAGLLAALAAQIMNLIEPNFSPAAAGVAVLCLLGGYARLRSVSGLFSEEGRVAGAAITSVLVLVSEVFLLLGLGKYHGNTAIYSALIGMPVTAAAAMVAAASALRSEDMEGMPLSGVKGLHMLLSSLLAFVALLPSFGWMALVFIAVAVLAGALTALIMQNGGKKETAASIAAVASQILFLIVLMLLEGRPVVYY